MRRTVLTITEPADLMLAQAKKVTGVEREMCLWAAFQCLREVSPELALELFNYLYLGGDEGRAALMARYQAAMT